MLFYQRPHVIAKTWEKDTFLTYVFCEPYVPFDGGPSSDEGH